MFSPEVNCLVVVVDDWALVVDRKFLIIGLCVCA